MDHDYIISLCIREGYTMKCKECKQEYGYIDEINLCHSCYIKLYTRKDKTICK